MNESNPSLNDIEELIKSVKLFAGIPPDELETLARAAWTKQFQKGAFVFTEGQPALNAYVVLEGEIRLSQVTLEGEQVIVQFVVSGDPFGIVAVLAGVEYPVTAEAVNDCIVIGWDRETLLGIMESTPQLALNALGVMARRFQELQARYRELATERVERRIARTVLRLGKQTGRKIKEGVLIDLPVSRQDLAEMTGTTIYTVSRTLSQWESRGLIETRNRSLIILKPHNLVSIAEDLPGH